MLHTKFVEKIKTHFMFNPKSVPALYEIMCKKRRYIPTGCRCHCNTTRVPCVLDKQDYGHTLRICNASCFSTTTMITRTRFNVTFICPISLYVVFFYLFSESLPKCICIHSNKGCFLSVLRVITDRGLGLNM
jgi:hypothetical protein